MLGVTAFTEAPFADIGIVYSAESEALTLLAEQTAIANFLGAQAEGVAVADSQAATADFLGSQDEGITLADSQTGVLTALSDQTESLTLTDEQDATAVFISTQEEAVILTDSQAATADFLSTQAENAALTDTQTGAVKYPVSGFDAIHLTDTQTDNYIFIRWTRTKQTIISQYANSPILLSLLSDWTEAIDPAVNIDAFYNLVWNVDTAVGYGLDVWGRIVNVSRILSLPGGRKFGYVVSSGAQDWDPLNQQQFYSGVTTTENYILADDAFRILILAKALANISNCAIPTYNRLLMQLFPNRGNVYVNDTGNMLFEIIFTFILQPFEIAIIEQSGVFVGPTGVGFTYQIILPQTLGFEGAGSTAEPYNQGIFFKGH